MMDAVPLRNELILSNIFQHLPPNDLAACRLVCCLWNQEVLLEIRKRVSVNFSASNVRHVPKFVETMQESASCEDAIVRFPYARFIMTICDQKAREHGADNGCSPLIPYATKRFFDIFGPCIKHLQLSINDFEKFLKDCEDRVWMAQRLENLQTLVLWGESAIGLEDKNVASISVDDRQTFAKLRSLTLKDSFGERDIDMKYPRRFNSQFVLNVFKMCPYVSELTVDTMDCKTKCSLVESVLEVLRRNHKIAATTGIKTSVKLIGLARVRFLAVVDPADLLAIAASQSELTICRPA